MFEHVRKGLESLEKLGTAGTKLGEAVEHVGTYNKILERARTCWNRCGKGRNLFEKLGSNLVKLVI